jgi:acetylornithine deacetylase
MAYTGRLLASSSFVSESAVLVLRGTFSSGVRPLSSLNQSAAGGKRLIEADKWLGECYNPDLSCPVLVRWLAVPLCPIETLARLVRIPSVNPMGADVTGPHLGEAQLTAALEEICQAHGWRWRRHTVHPGRDNLLAIVDGAPTPDQGGELLLWDVHQDTVSAEGMSVDPFGGESRDGRIYGRGACDVKGTMAAMLAALSRLDKPSRGAGSRADNRRRPTVLLACTVNEECGFTGAKALPSTWDRRPDAAIVAEPTELNVVVAHQGVVRWRAHTLGRAAHSSRPGEGLNAIYAMARVVRALETYAEQLSRTAGHPLCGRPSLCVSTIHGGVGINTVPDRATIEIDRRLPPGESPEVAYASVVEYLHGQLDLGACRVEHDPPFMQSPGLADGHNRKPAEHLAAIVHETGRSSELAGVPYGTDAAAIAAVGIPTMVFGPGSIAQAHTADEYIDIAELELATEVFHCIARDGLM